MAAAAPTDVVVYFDIDGVLADFNGHLDAQGCRRADGSPDWDKLDTRWWHGLPHLAGMRDVFMQTASQVTVRMLTSPVLSPDSFHGKALWVMDYLPHEGARALKRLIIASSADKRFLAGPGRILIDDRKRNVDEWVAAGGIGIHFTGDVAAVTTALAAYLPAPPKTATIRPANKP